MQGLSHRKTLENLASLENAPKEALEWALHYCPKGRAGRVEIGGVKVSRKLIDSAGLTCRNWLRLHRDKVNTLCDFGAELLEEPLPLKVNPQTGFVTVETDRTHIGNLPLNYAVDGIPIVALILETMRFYGEIEIKGNTAFFKEE